MKIGSANAAFSVSTEGQLSAHRKPESHTAGGIGQFSHAIIIYGHITSDKVSLKMLTYQGFKTPSERAFKTRNR